MNGLGAERESVREITVGRPGLNALIHDIENVESSQL